ncbi:hypothetical protein PBI_PIPP_51 [Gordonia phage Pipp]|nr:hypothetical protein PBI_PIPP_51 [Gordonia phage Pipp]
MVNIATRVILRGPKATLDDLAAFIAEARHRGVAGDTAIQFRGATGLGAFAAFSVDVPALNVPSTYQPSTSHSSPAINADESGGCTNSTALVKSSSALRGAPRSVSCELPTNHDGPHIALVDGQKYAWTDADAQSGGRP